MRTLLLTLVAGGAALGAVERAASDTLLLRSAVRASRDDGMVVLREVAELRGSDIARYSELVVATVPIGSPPKELGVEEIRRRLEQAGANWAIIDLEGRRVVVRPRSTDAHGAPAACAPATVEPAARRGGSPGRTGDDAGRGDPAARADAGGAPEARSMSDSGPGDPALRSAVAAGTRGSATRLAPGRSARRTAGDPIMAAAVAGEASVRGLVADAMQHALDEDADSIRLSFDGLDATTLAEVPPGMRIELDPIGVLDSDRAEFAVRWWRDGRVERRSNLSVFPEIARVAAVAPRDLRKGDRPDGDEWSSSNCWVKPSERHRVVRPGAVGGRAVDTTLREGEPLLESHLERALLVRRGDRIVVRTTVGSLAVSIDAIAQSDGREGETIECVRAGAAKNRDRNAISAVVIARGEAVVRPNGGAL